MIVVGGSAECWSRPGIWKEPRDSQSGIDGLEQPHLSLSRDGAIPHRYYWFLAGSSSITGWLWSDQLGYIAEQRHSLLVVPLQVNFRASASLIKGPLCLSHHHYVIQIFWCGFKWTFSKGLIESVLMCLLKGGAWYFCKELTALQAFSYFSYKYEFIYSILYIY